MDLKEIAALLESVAGGSLTPQQALNRFQAAPEVSTGTFANLDLDRRKRCGFPEVVYGPGKTTEQVLAIAKALVEHEQYPLITRLAPETAEQLLRAFPTARHSVLGRIVRIHPPEGPEPEPAGRVVVITAGTADLPVAEEARVVAEAWGCRAELVADVGVAGLHRLLNRLPQIRGADAYVAVAGMEAALPSVAGGLLDGPVIGVPTSVGYGAHFHGLASLLGMLNSCASNVTTVNIDGGFNGGYIAGMIASRVGKARQGKGPDFDG